MKRSVKTGGQVIIPFHMSFFAVACLCWGVKYRWTQSITGDTRGPINHRGAFIASAINQSGALFIALVSENLNGSVWGGYIDGRSIDVPLSKGRVRSSADLQLVTRGSWECWCLSNIWVPDYMGGCCLIHSEEDNWLQPSHSLNELQISSAKRIKRLLKATTGLPHADKHSLNKKQNFDYWTFCNSRGQTRTLQPDHLIEPHPVKS
ncbi:hypothetical protein CEXT_707511 [Caerostris extrusa]|uniref:Uncharacterized protein n=1 Tax=Caerostris extrusa TaxID=172846 RepID=A0AAV4Y6N0_CAEEX|nr:hypothetical protein CEXT_707511 [Caerostris extrusa]